MRKLVLLSVIIFLAACAPSTQTPVGNPTSSPEADLNGRSFVGVAANQPFKYSIVGAGLLQVGGGLVIAGGSPPSVGPTYNNLHVIGNMSEGRFTVTYDGYAQPDENSNVIVKALAEGREQGRGPYAVFFDGFTPVGIRMSLRDLRNDGPPSDFDKVNVMVEISRFSKT